MNLYYRETDCSIEGSRRNSLSKTLNINVTNTLHYPANEVELQRLLKRL